ncbi:aminoacyl--tRNA ligase-related protein, partial [Thermococcus sp. MAR1]
ALIPETEFQKEAEHIAGFEGEVFWVTHAGHDPLDIKLILRPTSETAMYSMFALWIRSHADLPFKVYQIVNTYRYETKHTRPLIRVREISRFFEAHTAHDSFEDAERQIKEDLEIFDNLAKFLAIPYIVSKRPDW